MRDREEGWIEKGVRGKMSNKMRRVYKIIERGRVELEEKRSKRGKGYMGT